MASETPLIGTGGTSSIGSARFTLFADTEPLEVALDRAEKEAKKASGAIGRELSTGANKGAQGLLALSYAIDDAQYGFKAIVNNIPQVATMFGMAGLAGAVGIAAVAINQLINHWDQLSVYFERADVRIQAQWMADLAEATKRAADEADRLLAAKTPSQEKLQGSVNAAIMGADPKMMLMGIQDVLLQGSKSKVTQRGGKFFEQGKQLDITEERARGIWADERAKIDAKAKNLLGSMSTDDHARRTVQEMIRQHPDAFPGMGGAADALKAASPEELAKKAIRDRAAMLTGEGERLEKLWQDTIGKELTKSGKEIEDQTRKKFEAEKKAGIDAIQGKIEAKEFQLDAMHKAHRDTNPSQVFSGTHAFASNMLTGSLDQIGKQQLKAQEAIRDQIQGLRRDMHKAQGMRFDN